MMVLSLLTVSSSYFLFFFCSRWFMFYLRNVFHVSFFSGFLTHFCPMGESLLPKPLRLGWESRRCLKRNRCFWMRVSSDLLPRSSGALAWNGQGCFHGNATIYCTALGEPAEDTLTYCGKNVASTTFIPPKYSNSLDLKIELRCQQKIGIGKRHDYAFILEGETPGTQMWTDRVCNILFRH